MIDLFVAILENWAVIIGSIIGLVVASKGKNPIGWFLGGLAIYGFAIFGYFAGYVRNPSVYAPSLGLTITSLVFCAIYLTITLTIAFRKYRKSNTEKIFYCVSCGSDFRGKVNEEYEAKLTCSKCGAHLVSTSILSRDWDKMNPEEKEEAVKKYKPTESEPTKSEFSKAEVMEPKASEIEHTELEPVETEPSDSVVHLQNLSNADEIRKYKALLDENIITQEDFDKKKKQLLGL